MYVIELGDTFKLLGKNKFEDSGEISSTPAISGGEVYLRTSKRLYCVAKTE